ncbi:hypothetical protein ACQI4F_18615 [Mycolicibacterium vaccae]|uniref:hypothetical protein n=1 Tax=Mycolicibacterium vaccae TaxID=1810 RepID=UPI003CEA249D
MVAQESRTRPKSVPALAVSVAAASLLGRPAGMLLLPYLAWSVFCGSIRRVAVELTLTRGQP